MRLTASRRLCTRVPRSRNSRQYRLALAQPCPSHARRRMRVCVASICGAQAQPCAVGSHTRIETSADTDYVRADHGMPACSGRHACDLQSESADAARDVQSIAGHGEWRHRCRRNIIGILRRRRGGRHSAVAASATGTAVHTQACWLSALRATRRTHPTIEVP